MILYKKVLLLEDDEDDQDTFKAALNESFPGIECVILPNGQEGLKFLKSAIKPDIIFSDISMPLINGKQFLKEYFTGNFYGSKCPVIMLSTSQAKKDYEECIKLGACYYLTKPTTFIELLQELEFILTRQW
jgi:DNA-binding response OmpR family regulator